MDVRLAKALSHPLRQRLLAALNDRVASPSDLAEELGARLGDVSYHTRQLHLHGCLDLVRTERRRGAIKHFYTASIRLEVEDDQWRDMPAADRGRIVDEIVGDLWRETARASRADRLSGDDVHISRTALLLDDQGWQDLGEALREVVERAQAVQDESGKRTAEARGAVLGILLFPAEEADPVRSSP